MDQTALTVLAVLGVYNVAMIAIGIYAMRRSKSENEFLIGGHKLGPWVGGFAYVASTSSAWVLLGFSGFVYTSGVSALWMVPGIIGGFAAVWLWVGPHLNREARKNGHVTLLDYLAHGADAKAKGRIAIISATLIVVCFTFYIASQFQGAGKAFESAVGVDLLTGLLIGAGVVLAYTFLGGFWAVSLTDTIQGGLMAVVAIILPAAAVMSIGGFGEIGAILVRTTPPEYMNPVGNAAGFAALGFVIGTISTGVASLGQPHNLNWIIALENEAARKRGAVIAIVWGVVVYAGMAVLGFAARAIFGTDAPAEGIFLELSKTLMPPILAGVVIASLLSAIMSTVDAQLLVTSGAISRDLGASRLAKNNEVWVTRIAVFAICAAAIVLTLFLPESIFKRVLFAWSALGAAFGPTVVARVIGWDLRPGAIMAAMMVGFGLTVLFYLTLKWPGDVDERIIPWIPAMLILWMGRRKLA
jgi:sodium/proline symporter